MTEVFEKTSSPGYFAVTQSVYLYDAVAHREDQRLKPRLDLELG